MDAEQRSVFQGIVYYYRENMVNCRYQVTLKDAVDGALLQQALDAARAKAPYYFQKPVWEKKLLHLEPSDAPCPVRQGSAKPEFPDENGFTVALSYEGKVVYFDWFHFMADGRGIAPFMTMVLQFYCNLRYGTAFEGRALVTDPPYDIEDILAKYPESQVANDMQRPVVQTFEETPTCCRIRLEKAGLVDAALRCGVKPFSALTALLCKAVRAYLDKDEVLYSYSTDARDALGAPNALYNCVASFQRRLPLTADAPLAEVAVGVDADLKENLSAERKLFRIAEQMGWVYRVYQQKASLSIKKRIFQMGEYISGFPADFWVSYLGDPFAPSSPELTRYIEDFQTWVPADGASIGLECTSLHGIITLCVKNKVPRPGFAEVLRAAFEAEGIKVLPEIEVPLTGSKKELDIVKNIIDTTAEKIFAEKGKKIKYEVGSMIELPRAALKADELAQSAEFFGFGTNDLTQTTLGMSRDDTGAILDEYRARGVYVADPFASIDVEGVGCLVKLACEKARCANPSIWLGVCGEHGGDPASIDFFQTCGMNYVSCSPYRVPVARLAAAQAAVRHKNDKKEECKDSCCCKKAC